MQRHQELYNQAMLYVAPTTISATKEAKEIAGQWTDNVIRDGAVEFHFPYADLELVESNGAREDWLTTRAEAASRKTKAKDCVTRALNEATGGMNYNSIWGQITEKRKQYAQIRTPTSVWHRTYTVTSTNNMGCKMS